MSSGVTAIISGALSCRILLISGVLILGGAANSFPRGSASKDDCANAARFADPRRFSYFAPGHPYLHESTRHLAKRIPELARLRRARDQRLLPVILKETGDRAADFFRNMVDAVAREQVRQEILGPAGVVLTRQETKYDYLILPKAGHEIPPVYEEYRTGSGPQPVEQSGVEQGYAITSGFVLKSAYFLPELQAGSTFRYLGEQTLNSRETYVIAFAQRPEDARFWGSVFTPLGRVRVLDQGIAWVDQQTFQIVRLRTDLLAPHSEIGLSEQTTEITLSQVRIADVPQPLWLPTEVRVYALFQGQAFRNEHRYTDYQRFRVSVQMGNVTY